MTISSRAVVIGLDGASPDLARRWADSGDLPVLRTLMDRGTLAPLRSTVPPVSPAAWCTFMTGMNPAGHGVLGFRNLDARRYEFHEPDIISSKPVAGRTFWDVAGRHGARVGALWVPVTYPPWPVNGLLVCGYPTPGPGRSYGYPESAAASVPALTEDSALFQSARPARIEKELFRLARERGRAAAELLRRETFDLLVVVIGSIDRAQHDFWRHFDPDSPAHDPAEAERFGSTIREVYRAADRAVGEILEAAPPDAPVFILSDHGGGPAAERQVHLNAWLRERGLLAACRQKPARSLVTRGYGWLKERVPAKEKIFRRLPRSLRERLTSFDADATLGLRAVDWPRTRAYRFPMYPPFEGIEINLKGRQSHGCVRPEEYEKVRDRILEALRAMRDPSDGKSIVANAFRREEIYSGEHLERLPDLVVEWNPGYAAGSEIFGDWVAPVPLERLRRLSGAHRMDGILIAAGPALRQGARVEGASIGDVAPTVLYAMGLPRPDSMDGRVLTELFKAEHLSAHPVECSKSDPQAVEPSRRGLSEAEQAEIAEHLRGLGYLD